jgi:beta-N-acetylhexosaminidase
MELMRCVGCGSMSLPGTCSVCGVVVECVARPAAGLLQQSARSAPAMTRSRPGPMQPGRQARRSLRLVTARQMIPFVAILLALVLGIVVWRQPAGARLSVDTIRPRSTVTDTTLSSGPPSIAADESPESTSGSTGALVTEPELTTALLKVTGPQRCLASLPLRDRLAMLVWPGVDASRWQRAVEAVGINHLGGVVLMTAPTEDELASTIAAIKAANPRGLLVATDEEGGLVQRLSALERLASQESIAQSESPAEAEETVARHGRIIREVGIDVVLGPVVDVKPPGGVSPIGVGRLFSDDPQAVVDFGRAYVRGWERAGLLPVLKHFPGHGSSTVDTHNGPGQTPPLESLQKRDLRPYVDLSSLQPAVMLSHLSIPDLTDGEPTSTNKKAIELLRGMGFADALVMTDSLTMTAVKSQGGVAQSAVLSVAAGADVVLFTTIDPLRETSAVLDALERAVSAGTIRDEAVTISAGRVARYLRDQEAFCEAK